MNLEKVAYITALLRQEAGSLEKIALHKSYEKNGKYYSGDGKEISKAEYMKYMKDMKKEDMEESGESPAEEASEKTAEVLCTLFIKECGIKSKAAGYAMKALSALKAGGAAAKATKAGQAISKGVSSYREGAGTLGRSLKRGYKSGGTHGAALSGKRFFQGMNMVGADPAARAKRRIAAAAGTAVAGAVGTYGAKKAIIG